MSIISTTQMYTVSKLKLHRRGIKLENVFRHRPFSCFYWHFQNQRRRRPVCRPDGTFSYDPDFYCNDYDEQSGICPNGDEYVEIKSFFPH